MAKIVAIHGVGQQFKGDAVIHREWWPAFLSGLHLSGCVPVNEGDFDCPFYGHLFRRLGTLSLSEQWQAKDLEEDEVALLQVIWSATAEAEPDVVPSLAEFAAETGLARTPQIVQRALSALARSRFWANVSQSLLIGDLKQVTRYFSDVGLRNKILDIVCDKITSETRLVVGHSLGSVVAYEALSRKPEEVVSFISIGSPLGIRNLIFDKLAPTPSAGGIGVWPGRIKSWTNIADKGDVVALQKRLAPLFGDRVKDILVSNGSDPHHGERYLTTREVGEAACEALWTKGF